MSHSALPSTTKYVQIAAFGLNHQTCDITTREKLALSREESSFILRKIQRHFPDIEVALLSTCNRTEWYIYSPSSLPDIGNWLVNKHIIDAQTLESETFYHHERQAIRHIYRVASGLDSLILGEPQILGQFKSAYRLAKEIGCIGSVLERLFQQSFATAKRIRSSTAIGENPVSVAYAGVKLTHQFFDDHEKRNALIIGAGETGQLVARYLHDIGLKHIIIANRTLEKAQIVAEKVGGYAIRLDNINDHLHDVDMIFGCIQSDHLLLTQHQIYASLKKRHHAFQVLIDLSMPRIFATDINQISTAFSYCVDDLEQIVDTNRDSRSKAAKQAEIIINLCSDDFIGWLNSKPQQQLIRRIRSQADSIRQALLNDAYRRLAHGEDPAKLLEELSYKLTNKLLHSPSAMIHAIPPNHKDWLAIVADTFDHERT